MAASITKIEKKLASLKNAKAKEEQKHKDLVEKLTAKYAEDTRLLKENYEAKLSELKESHATKLEEINPEIEFYNKQKLMIEKLQAQLESLDYATDVRLGKVKQDEEEENVESEETEEVEESEEVVDEPETSTEEVNEESEEEQTETYHNEGEGYY